MDLSALLLARARINHLGTPPPSGIVIVGNTGGHTTSGSSTIALPSGCSAGDYAVIAVARASTCTITPPTGATDLLADYAYYSTVAIAHVYGYTLTATDVANGYVSFSASTTANWYALTVLHGQNATPVDVTGTAATASPNNTHPVTCPANSVTTTAANDVVLAFGFAQLASGVATTWTTPSGWSVVSTPSTANYAYQCAVYSLTQTTAGATGNASIGANASANLRGGGIQIAFKPA